MTGRSHRPALAAALALGAAALALAAAPPRDDPPPLVVDEEAPLLLESPAAPPAAEATRARAANAACFVCHANYKREALADGHAAHGVACTRCHGDSTAHRNDESNTTPPDVMVPLASIDTACAACHATHDVPAADVVARFADRRDRLGDRAAPVCTDCHGDHRLARRSVRWDRATGKLLGHDAPAPP